MTDSHLIAWAAGFLDGEGYFAAPARPPSYRPVVTATQIALSPLYQLRDIFGGHIMDHASNGASRWQLHGATAVRPCLVAIIPYLVLKKAQANLLYHICTLIPAQGSAPCSPEDRETRDALAELLDDERRAYRHVQTAHAL